jgi:alpha-acetolactate decarboxylase
MKKECFKGPVDLNNLAQGSYLRNQNIPKVLITNFQYDIKFNGKETVQIEQNKMLIKTVFRSKSSSRKSRYLSFSKKFQNLATLIYR